MAVAPAAEEDVRPSLGAGDFAPAPRNWRWVDSVPFAKRTGETTEASPAGTILLNTPGKNSRGNLFTAREHGDLDMELEFMMAPGSNSGVYLQGRYEVQLLDSFGVANPQYSDCGGIYQRWDERRPPGQEGYQGHPPALNACKPPGAWQRLRIEFRAPRFDAAGRKVKNARFVKVTLNGATLHENTDVTGPTRAAAFADENPAGPLMIQGDHGAVAIRNLRYLAAAPGMASVAPAADPLQWTNPIAKDRADPHVFLHADGWYYFTASVPEYDRIELRRARTLGGLTAAEPKVIWRKHADGPMSKHIWAPEIHFIGGKWYVYFAAGEAKRIWNIRMYVLENDSTNPLEGTWTEKGLLKTDRDSMTLDATTFEHRGVRYLAWAQTEPKKSASNIYLAKMDTPWSITGGQVKIAEATLPWELRQFKVQEGPAVLIKNDRVFMTYSTNSTDWKYCMGLLIARADADLLDPKSWTKSSGPVLDSDPQTNQWGPGHNGFTTTPDGETDILVYHSRNYKYEGKDPLNTGDRATHVRIIRWHPDGTPDFGAPTP